MPQNIFRNFHIPKSMNFCVHIGTNKPKVLWMLVYDALFPFRVEIFECRVTLFFNSTLINNSLTMTNTFIFVGVTNGCIFLQTQIGMPYIRSLSCYQTLTHMTSRMLTPTTIVIYDSEMLVNQSKFCLVCYHHCCHCRLCKAIKSVA